MTPDTWQTKRLPVASLLLDCKNPRLGSNFAQSTPREIMQHLFEHYRALDVAQSIAERGFFPNEALLAYKNGKDCIVVEGNRRLAALKALQNPTLLEGSLRNKVEQLAHSIKDRNKIAKVPVTIAPNREATDPQLVARHIGKPVYPWEAENRASFILGKLNEGYTNETLSDKLGFTTSDIQKARQTRAIAEMARALSLPEEIVAKLNNPKANLFSTLERVFDSTTGKKYLNVQACPEHGLRGTTTKAEFERVFKQLVTDVALRNVTSRTLNTNENIEKYFKSWPPDEQPKKKKGSFLPKDIIGQKKTPSPKQLSKDPARPKRSSRESKTVLPKSLKVRHGGTRIKEIHRELTKIKRDDFPNAGAVLLRVFFELTITHYLKRIGVYSEIIEDLKKKGKSQNASLTTKQMIPSLLKLVKTNFSTEVASTIEKAITHNKAAPFSISELNAFIHNPNDMPSGRDLLQFWERTESLFRLMLEQDGESPEQ